MPRLRFPSVARKLQNEVPDADLLERYVQQNSDDAFGQLVARYSRLVWGQCRNSLANDADADDAFQAAFLTLARSAKTLKPDIPLGPWLHGVAFRVCKNARRAMARRTKRERASAQPESNRPIADSAWEVAFAAVAEEVQKLPDAQRVAFVLCCIEGRATTEAAESLGQKLGTFSARLTRAKQTLLSRLAKRGISASVLALGGVTGSVSIAPAALIARTLAWLPSGVVVPSSIQVLTYGVTGMMLLRFKVLAAGVLVATGLGLSVGGGWSGTVVAQAPSDLAPGAATKSKKAAEKAELNLENLKEQLAQFKKQQSEEIAKLRKRFDNTTVVEDYEELKDLNATPKLKPLANFEYEPVPSSHEEFESKLAAREKAGWAFVGEVTFRASEKLVPTLVFRKKSGADARVLQGGIGSIEFYPKGYTTQVSPLLNSKQVYPVVPAIPGSPAGVAPVAPVPPVPPVAGFPTPKFAPSGSGIVNEKDAAKVAEAVLQANIDALEKELRALKANPGSPRFFAPVAPVPPASFAPVAPVAPVAGVPTPPVAPVKPKASSGSVNELLPKLDAELQANIAALEKDLKALKALKPNANWFKETSPEAELESREFTKKEFGNWDPADLAEVLGNLIAADVKAKKYKNAKVEITVQNGSILFKGSPEATASIVGWVKKLKQ